MLFQKYFQKGKCFGKPKRKDHADGVLLNHKGNFEGSTSYEEKNDC